MTWNGPVEMGERWAGMLDVAMRPAWWRSQNLAALMDRKCRLQLPEMSLAEPE